MKLKDKIRLLFFVLPIFLLGVLVGATLPELKALSDKAYKSLDTFSKVLFLVERDYVEKVDDQELVYGAIKGLLGTLDPYSVFLTPDIYKELKVDTVGQFGGVGLEVTLENGILTVVSPIEDTPAEKAGIQPGDKILKINNKSTKGMNLADAVRRMRGIKKSKVTLTLYREGIKKPFDIQVERDVIQVKSVKAKMLPGGIAYLRLTNFQERTSEELKNNIQKLRQESPEAIKAFILDLRNNPGGLLEEAIAISDFFLSKGKIVSTKGRSGFNEENVATLESTDLKEPVLVLLNQGSASASEIVAGALQDNKRAKVLGAKSYGKASVQTVIDLGEDTGLKLTIAKYYTPSGKSISGEGIKPDFPVKGLWEIDPQAKRDFNDFANPETDPQLKAAVAYLQTGKIPPEQLVTKKSSENSKNNSEKIETIPYTDLEAD